MKASISTASDCTHQVAFGAKTKDVNEFYANNAFFLPLVDHTVNPNNPLDWTGR